MENKELNTAWHIIANTDTHVFLTGKAGTGKTTFLRHLKQELPKRMVVLAPTGIAAINAQGTTIHSFFQLNFGPQIPETGASKRNKKYQFRKNKLQLIRSLDLIVIDEISMVRADILDAIDRVLRQYRDRSRPFGGIQMLLIGDMQQLAPVAKEDEWQLLREYYDTPYFFSSHALQQTDFVTVELQHVFRQSNPVFLEILNKIRTNTIDDEGLSQLNKRYIPDFMPPKEDGYIRLCTHNRQAEAINHKELAALKTTSQIFEAEIDGDFPELSYPTDYNLELKVGAQVMFVKNDSSYAKEYYNGMIGEITDISNNGHIYVKCLDTGKEIKVGHETWVNTKYSLDPKTKDIIEEVVGQFVQYPIKTAWAITIHKSQGLTFEHAIIDVQHSFAHGQTYVALSRCKSLEGLVLSNPIPRYAIINDTIVEQFTNDPRHQEPTEEKLLVMEQLYLTRTIDELFSLSLIHQGINDTIRFLREHFYSQMPKTYAKWQEAAEKLKPLEDVAARFHYQYATIIGTTTPSDKTSIEGNTTLQERLKKGATYFEEQLLFIRALIKGTTLNSDSKNIRERRDDILGTLEGNYKLKFQLLHYVSQNGFNLQDYLKKKACLSIS